MDGFSSINKYTKSFDDTQIAYNVLPSESSSGHTLIFIHGLGGDLAAWDTERSLLYKAGYKTIAIDLRGHGLSDRPRYEGAYVLKNFVKDIIAVLKAEDIEKPVVVGHCFGAMVSLLLEAEYPSTSRALVLVDTSFKSPTFSPKAADHRIMNSIFSFIARHAPTVHENGHVNTAKFIGSTDFSARRILSDVLHTSLRSYLSVCEDIAGYDATKLLEKIHVPALIITGTEDLIFPPQTAEKLHHRIHDSHISYIEGGNHMVVINNPKDIVEDILTFLKNINYSK